MEKAKLHYTMQFFVAMLKLFKCYLMLAPIQTANLNHHCFQQALLHSIQPLNEGMWKL